MFKLVLYFFLLSLLTQLPRYALAQSSKDIDLQSKQLSEKYHAGSYLIFDCREKFWACVDEVDFLRCKKYEKRTSSCRPFTTFDDLHECQKQQQILVERNGHESFCQSQN